MRGYESALVLALVGRWVGGGWWWLTWLGYQTFSKYFHDSLNSECPTVSKISYLSVKAG